MGAPYFPDWRGVHHSEHLPGILCTSRNMFSGYIPVKNTSAIYQCNQLENYLNKISYKPPRGQWVKLHCFQAIQNLCEGVYLQEESLHHTVTKLLDPQAAGS